MKKISTKNTEVWTAVVVRETLIMTELEKYLSFPYWKRKTGIKSFCWNREGLAISESRVTLYVNCVKITWVIIILTNLNFILHPGLTATHFQGKQQDQGPWWQLSVAHGHLLPSMGQELSTQGRNHTMLHNTVTFQISHQIFSCQWYFVIKATTK